MDGCFILVDDQPQAYSELWSYAPTGKENKGDGIEKQDVFGFFLTNGMASTDLPVVLAEIAIIYKAQQVRALKEIGMGSNFKSGDRVFYICNDKKVSPTHTGNIGVDFFYCGTCKKDADAFEESVLMNYDGTQYKNADMA